MILTVRRVATFIFVTESPERKSVIRNTMAPADDGGRLRG